MEKRQYVLSRVGKKTCPFFSLPLSLSTGCTISFHALNRGSKFPKLQQMETCKIWPPQPPRSAVAVEKSQAWSARKGDEANFIKIKKKIISSREPLFIQDSFSGVRIHLECFRKIFQNEQKNLVFTSNSPSIPLSCSLAPVPICRNPRPFPRRPRTSRPAHCPKILRK